MTKDLALTSFGPPLACPRRRQSLKVPNRYLPCLGTLRPELLELLEPLWPAPHVMYGGKRARDEDKECTLFGSDHLILGLRECIIRLQVAGYSPGGRGQIGLDLVSMVMAGAAATVSRHKKAIRF